MLVLSRKLNQEIVIGDNVKVTVLKVKGNTVRLGIEAPRNIRVVRGELPPHEETKQPQMAEVTIVFNDSKDKPVDDDSIDVVPFPAKSTRTRISDSNSTNSKSGTTTSQTSRQPLPPTLSSNRLRDILAELSGQ